MSLQVRDATATTQYLLSRGAGTSGDPMKTINDSLELAIASGDVPGFSVVQKFGYNGNVSTSLVPITAAGTYQTPSTLTSVEIVSSSTDDASGGIGAQKVKVLGLSTGWTEIEEEVTLSGTTPVPLSNQFYRIYRAYVTESGTYGTATASSHVGTITVRTASAGATWVQIGLIGTFGLGQTQCGAYTVPLGKTGYVWSKTITIQSQKEVDLFMFQRPNCNDVTTPFTGAIRIVEQHQGAKDVITIRPKTPIGPFVGPCDIGFMAKTTAGSAGVSVDFEIILEDN